jgi:diadenosine tetraphosphate (Ap4A) HIT family hydrolase
MISKTCPLCLDQSSDQVAHRGRYNFIMRTNDPVLVGSLMILPIEHRETVFDLTQEEWDEAQELLARAKELIDADVSPDGYSVGWNVGEAGGQTIPHVHLHVIPRHADEPLAGKGIRAHIKQPTNRRPS